MMRASVIVMSGPSGSGKSAWAEAQGGVVVSAEALSLEEGLDLVDAALEAGAEEALEAAEWAAEAAYELGGAAGRQLFEAELRSALSPSAAAEARLDEARAAEEAARALEDRACALLKRARAAGQTRRDL